jgi:hypothetical protein
MRVERERQPVDALEVFAAGGELLLEPGQVAVRGLLHRDHRFDLHVHPWVWPTVRPLLASGPPSVDQTVPAARPPLQA